MADVAPDTAVLQMPRLTIAAECLPVPLPSEEVQKVRDWLRRVLPLDACLQFARSIREVRFDCGRDTPEWVRKIAREIVIARPTPETVQLACYRAISDHAFIEGCQRVFDRKFNSHPYAVNVPLKLARYMSDYYWRGLEYHAMNTIEFRENPAAGWFAISQVYFEVSCDPLLFPEELDKPMSLKAY